MSLRCFYVIVSCIFSACHLILIKVSSQKHINLDVLSQHALTQHFLRFVLGWSTCLINFLFHISLSWHCCISSISDDLKSPLRQKSWVIAAWWFGVSPGGFASLEFDQAIPKNSQHHLAYQNAICIVHRSDFAWLCCSLSQLHLNSLSIFSALFQH